MVQTDQHLCCLAFFGSTTVAVDSVGSSLVASYVLLVKESGYSCNQSAKLLENIPPKVCVCVFFIATLITVNIC